MDLAVIGRRPEVAASEADEVKFVPLTPREGGAWRRNFLCFLIFLLLVTRWLAHVYVRRCLDFLEGIRLGALSLLGHEYFHIRIWAACEVFLCTGLCMDS